MISGVYISYLYRTCITFRPTLLSLGELLSTNFATMDVVLTNTLPMSVSTFMKEDKVNATKLATSLTKHLLIMDPHKYAMQDYFDWNAKVEGWCDNLKGLIAELEGLQMIVLKQRRNIPDNLIHIDG